MTLKFADFSGRSRLIGVATLMLCISAGPAMAAGGAVPTLVQDISAALLSRKETHIAGRGLASRRSNEDA